MIRLTYIFHSGFVVETAAGMLVFDYWLDLANVLPKCLSRRGGRHVYVFASHFHEDHFTKDIFGWKQSLGSDVTYILSKDILKHRRADKGEADVWLAKGGTWADENIQVTATGSNDSGVSWIVETGGKRIFHAGDLCNWYARFLADGNKDRQPYSEELGEDIDPVAEEKRFLGELKDIQKIAKGFDLVMFPVDGRIGNGYALGARQFIERFQVGMFVPMHFVLSGFESAWRMEPFCQEKHVPFWWLPLPILQNTTLITVNQPLANFCFVTQNQRGTKTGQNHGKIKSRTLRPKYPLWNISVSFAKVQICPLKNEGKSLFLSFTTHFPTIVLQMWLLQTVLTSNGLVCENWVLNFVLRSVGHFQKRELAIEPKICHPYCPILGFGSV